MQANRRRMLFSLAPVAGVLGATTVEAAQRSNTGPSDTERRVADAADEIVRQIRAQGDPSVLRTIRDAQTAFLRANQRFPEFIEVGIGVWEQLWDWHVHTGQQPVIGQVSDGRYGMKVFLTTLVLHPGATTAYVGPGSASL